MPSFASEPLADTGYLCHSVYAGYSLSNSSMLFVRSSNDTYRLSGVLNMGYEYRPFRILGVGADFGWMNNEGEYRDQIYYAGGVSMPTSAPYRRNIFLLSANLRGIWVDLNHFSLYSAVRAGLALGVGDKKCSGGFNLQLVPIGIEVGVKSIGAYAELSIGTVSALSLGARYHF